MLEEPAAGLAHETDPLQAKLSRRAVLADDVYEVIKGLIMDMEFPPSARINVDALARRLGVSITPIREALSRLESDGLVEKQPLKGIFTTPLLSEQEFEDMYELRLYLEPAAAGRAAQRLSTGIGQRLRTLLDELPAETSLTGYDGFRALMLHDAVFHQAIHVASGNQMVTQALARLHCHLHLFRFGYESATGEATVKEHRALYQAIASGDTDAAVNAMTVHLESARDRLRSRHH
ncbi:GntR family transcriptional regulator [Kribbella sp. NPDC050820]|uniref:GntR family transcriptional regulator n=1 Tax=Kribbella sp. NPDC050820 TaxID=3155408 RepID=UPI0033F21B7A